MGAEKWGLSADAQELIDQFITVPMVGMVESFNV
jgi:tRNA G18 (ribose-2'-O)-methylase SpoU